MKPRLGEAKRPILGKTVDRLPESTPNHVASVAKYWSIAVVGNPASGAGVVRAIDGECGKLAIGALAFDGTSEDQMMTAPPVITALAIARKCSTEIARRETGHIFESPSCSIAR